MKETIKEKKNTLYSELNESQKKIMDSLLKNKQNKNKEKAYEKNIRTACQMLSEAEFDVLEDGEKITGAMILAVGAFERAKDNDKALQTFTKITGDMEDKVVTSTPFEDFIKDATTKM